MIVESLSSGEDTRCAPGRASDLASPRSSDRSALRGKATRLPLGLLVSIGVIAAMFLVALLLFIDLMR